MKKNNKLEKKISKIIAQKVADRELTVKQAKFVTDYIITGNGTRSALENYATTDYNTAHAIAIDNLQNPTIQRTIEQIFNIISISKYGVTVEEKIAFVLLDSLTATKISGE